jgi:alpha-tubulin suppressor-like RCC1 family protein
LGLGDYQNRNVPTLIPNIKAKQIAVGLNHSLILDLKGNVYAFGFNVGQLGLGDNQDRNVPTMIPNIKASQIAAGENHSLLIDLESKVSDPSSTGGRVSDPSSGRVSAPSSGRVSDPSSGRVYAFGFNDVGQLGLGDNQNRYVPTVIPNIKARQVAAGSGYSLLIESLAGGRVSDPSSGRVYAFGSNHFGQLGLGDNQNRNVPTLIPNIKAKQVAAGENHSLILALEGNIFDPLAGGRVSDPPSGRVSDPPSGRVYAFGLNDGQSR